MRSLGWVGLSCVLAWSSGACFKPALERELDVEDTGDTEDTAEVEVEADTNTGETSTDSVADTLSDTSIDTLDDAPDTTDTLDTAAPPEVTSPACSLDNECTSLARPPCVVGRCVQQRCAAVNVSVPCDDGDVCTTADQCQAGTCSGRAFTAEESKNWIERLSGTGSVAVIGHVTHPSGEVTLVGAFEGSLSVPGRASLNAVGGLDAFLIRFLEGGQVVQAISWGGPGADSPLFIAESNDEVVVAWAERLPDSLDTPLHFYDTVRRQDTEVTQTNLPAPPVHLDAAAGGFVLVAGLVEGETTLPNTQGGSTVLQSSSGTNAFVARLRFGSASWVIPITGYDPELGIKVLSMEDDDFVLVGLAPGGRVGSEVLVQSERPASEIWAVRLARDTGVIQATEPVDPAWSFLAWANRFERETVALTLLRLNDERLELKSRHGPTPMSSTCSRSMLLADADLASGQEFGGPSGHSYGLYASAGQSLSLDQDVTIQSGPHTLAIGVFDPSCRAQRLIPLALQVADEQPAAVLSLRPQRLSFTSLAASRRARLFLSGPLRQVTQPGGPFGPTVLTPTHAYEGFVGSIGPHDAHGCVLAD